MGHVTGLKLSQLRYDRPVNYLQAAASSFPRIFLRVPLTGALAHSFLGNVIVEKRADAG